MRRPSPALVISIIALVFAMGGTGWAVTQLPRNSVGTPQLKNNAVTGAKVKSGSLEASDFRKGALPRGEQGPQGPAGATGPQGPSGITSVAAASVGSVSTPLDAVTYQRIMALAPASPSGSRKSTGPIVVDRASRLVVTYAVTVELVTTPTAPGPTATCDLVINDELVSLNGIAEPTGAKAPSNQGEFTLSGTGYIAVAPGTYDIAVLCAKTAVSGQVDFRRGTLTVVAAAS